MASIRQSIRSSTASKRPTSAIADGQIALNTASGTPGMFFKDSANNIIKAGPAHYGASAPNSSPAVGGSTGNSIGEAWLDNSLTPAGWKIWSGSAWVNATPLSSDTVQGLVELATNAETQAGVDAARAVTAAGLQSKVSDSISTTSASGIASSTAVKTAYDLANAALPKSGGIVTGLLEIGSTGIFRFEGSSADGAETTLAVVNPTADRTITFPDVTGTVVTTGDSGTVTGTMIADNTILNAEVSPTAAIAFSKLASLTSANILLGNASGVPTATAVTGDVTITNSGVTAIASNVIVNADINSAAAIAYSKLALSSGITNTDISASAAIVYSKLALSSGITNTDINASAAIAGTKISPNFGSQNIVTTGNITAANHIAASGTAAAPSITISGDLNTGIYSPGADQLAVATNGTGRLFIDASGNIGVGVTPIDVAGYNSIQIGDTNGVFFDCFTGATHEARILSLPGDLRINQITSGSLGLYTNNTERLRITSAGLVGIGTTSPSSLLHLGAASGTIQMQFNNGGTSSYIGHDSGFTGLDLAAGGGIKFRYYTGTVFAEAARVDTSGRLLVGTSTSLSNAVEGGVQIVGTAADAYLTLTRFGGATASAPAGIVLGRSRSGTKGTNTAVSDGDFLGVVEFTGADGGTSYRSAAQIAAYVDGAVSGGGAADMPGRLVFSTTADGASSPTERMRITSAGSAQYAAATTGIVSGSVSAAGTTYTTFIGQYNTSSGPGTGTNSFLVYTNGNVQNTNNSYGALSDIKLKENIVDAGSQWADIKAFRVRKYNLKEGQTHTQIGGIAQEVELVSPGLVTESPDRDEEGNDLGTVTKSINYSVLYMKAVKALQEAMERIETLEASNADMLARVTALEAA